MKQTIGRYEIKEKLGEGGMADVYLAHDPNFDRLVVVKVIKREYSANSEFRSRFHREARVIAKLEHEAIVPVHDFGEQDGQPYIVMRRMTGGSLTDRLASGPLSLPEVAHIIERVADALDHAHNQGIIHRDLKPGNILFDERGKAYLSDFGIAKVAEAATNLTGTGIIGTPAYMSPEQARAMYDLDGRSDVYSLGVVVFELLTGHLPYSARDAVGMALAHVSEPVPDIRKDQPKLPRESDSLIKRALAKKPADRYQTTGELAKDLSLLATKPSLKSHKPTQAEGVSLLQKSTLPSDMPPTGEPQNSPRLPAGKSRWPVWVLPLITIVLCSVVILIGGIAAMPALVAQLAQGVAIASATQSPTPVHTLVPPTLTPIPTSTATPTSFPAASEYRVVLRYEKPQVLDGFQSLQGRLTASGYQVEINQGYGFPGPQDAILYGAPSCLDAIADITGRAIDLIQLSNIPVQRLVSTDNSANSKIIIIQIADETRFPISPQ